MTILLFTWYLLTYPTDKLICSLWVNQPPTQSQVIHACGSLDLSAYRLDVVPIKGTGIICSKPADAIYQVMDACRLNETLDQFHLQIIQPDYTTLICSITVQHEGEPTAAEINIACPNASAGHLQFIKSEPLPPPTPLSICQPTAIQPGIGLYQQAISIADLSTSDDLTWLAGRMIWFGMVHADCGDIGSLDPNTLAASPCGLDAARTLMISWQNQFDPDIFDAGISFSVPALLLKRVMEIESQFWPLWSSTTGEVGLMQITENGADVFLRYDPNFDSGYPSKKVKAQNRERSSFMNSLQCYFCDLDQAISKARQLIPVFARILAAYRCRAVSINPSLNGDDAWRQAVIDYNGSIDYLRKVEQ